MRALLLLLFFLLAGCAGDLARVAPNQLTTNVVVRAVLETNVQVIRFVLAESFRENPVESRIKVTLSNSCERTILIRIPGAFADVPSDTAIELISEDSVERLGRSEFFIWSWSSHADYDLSIQFSSPTPSDSVRVLRSELPLPQGPFLRRGDYSERLGNSVHDVLIAHRFELPHTVLRDADSSIWFAIDRFETKWRFDRLHIRVTAEEEISAFITPYIRGPSAWGTAGKLLLTADPALEADAIVKEITQKLHLPGEARWWRVDGLPVPYSRPGAL